MGSGFRARRCVRWLVLVCVPRDVKFVLLELMIMIYTVMQNRSDEDNGMSCNGMER